MKIKEIKVYEFKELEEKVKEKVLNNFRNDNDYDFLEEDLEEYLKEMLEKENITYEDLKINYSLSYCQGDGFSFTGNFIYKNIPILIKRDGFNYYHERSTEIIILNEEDFKKMDFEIFETDFKDLYYNICKKIEKMGYEMMEYEDSDESIKEIIEINEYTFRENGEMENI